MNAAKAFVQRVQAMVLTDADELFPACVSTDLEHVRRIASVHPTLCIYTWSSWGTENWIHRGIRHVHPLGYLLGGVDLGSAFSTMLWEDVPGP